MDHTNAPAPASASLAGTPRLAQLVIDHENSAVLVTDGGVITEERLKSCVRELTFGPEGPEQESAIASVVERMRAADRDDINQARNDGARAGAQWAKDEARPRQLRLLEMMRDDPEGTERYLAMWDNEANRGIAWHLYQALHPNEDTDGPAVESFWEQVLGRGGREKINDPAFASSFISGANAVWSEVKDKL